MTLNLWYFAKKIIFITNIYTYIYNSSSFKIEGSEKLSCGLISHMKFFLDHILQAIKAWTVFVLSAQFKIQHGSVC